MGWLAPRTLVLSGAGSNASMHLAALEMVQRYLKIPKLRDHFRILRGVSAGAMICVMIAAGLSLEDIVQRVFRLITLILNKPVDIICSLRSVGVSSLESFRKEIEVILGETQTFAELHDSTGVDLSIGAVNLNRREFCMLDHITTPNVSVATAVIASMSIPAVFPPVLINRDLYLDGGIQVNFPFPPHLWIERDLPETPCLGMWVRCLNDPVDSVLPAWSDVVPAVNKSMMTSSDLITAKVCKAWPRAHVIHLDHRTNGLALNRCADTSLQIPLILSGRRKALSFLVRMAGAEAASCVHPKEGFFAWVCILSLALAVWIQKNNP